MATLAQVAKKAGVSQATASLALNGRQSVAPRTRDKVLSAAKALKYERRSGLGPRIRSPDGVRIAFICNLSLEHLRGSDYTRGILAGCSAAAATLNTKMGYYHVSAEGQTGLLPVAGTVDGVIVLSYAGLAGHTALLSQLRSLKTPIIQLDSYPPTDADLIQSGEAAGTESIHRNVRMIRPDNLGGMDRIVAYLHGLGHREFGVATGNIEHVNHLERRTGARMALERRGIRLPDENAILPLTQVGDQDPELDALLDRRPRITALICSCDSLVPMVMRVLKRRGLRVPQDISLTGFDNLPIASHLDPPVTTINAHMEEMGMTAVEHLVYATATGVFRPAILSIPGELVIRGSCAPVNRPAPP